MAKTIFENFRYMIKKNGTWVNASKANYELAKQNGDPVRKKEKNSTEWIIENNSGETKKEKPKFQVWIP